FSALDRSKAVRVAAIVPRFADGTLTVDEKNLRLSGPAFAIQTGGLFTVPPGQVHSKDLYSFSSILARNSLNINCLRYLLKHAQRCGLRLRILLRTVVYAQDDGCPSRASRLDQPCACGKRA